MPCCRTLTLAAVPALALAAPGVGAAQSGAPLGAAAPAPAGALTFALGSELAGRDHVLGRYTHGVAAQLGYERRLGAAGSPFALRLAGDYWRSGDNTFAPYRGMGTPEDLTYTRRTKIFGASLLGKYQLPLSLGAVRPYALAGVGVYQYGATNEAAIPGGGIAVYQAGDHQTSVAYTGGLGASVRVGHLDLFGEGRLMTMPGFSRVSSSRTPLTLGARLPF